MIMTFQIALLTNIHPMPLLNTLNTPPTDTDPSLFLSEAEINRFILLDLDVDSMNESIDIESSEGWFGSELKMMP